jgi:hypothetical protein
MPDTDPPIIATVRNVSFGNKPTYFDLEAPHSIQGLVKLLLASRAHTRHVAAAVVAEPGCEMCEQFLNESIHEGVELAESIYNWFRAHGRRWNRYHIFDHWVFCTKGDDQGRFFAVVCDHAGRIPCCGCGGFGIRVERNVRGHVAGPPSLNITRQCPICEGRGTILTAPDVVELTPKEAAHAHPVA